MAQLNFNAGNQEGMDDFSVIPVGEYNVQIVKSEVTETKAKTGTLLKLQFKVIDGKYKGRIVFGQYNLTNPNAQAVEISRKQMKTLCDSIGKPDGVQDSNEMHNIPLKIKVGIRPAQGVYPEQNEIKFYSKYDGPAVEGAASATNNPGNPAASDAPAQQEADPAQEQPAASSGGGAPWNQ